MAVNIEAYLRKAKLLDDEARKKREKEAQQRKSGSTTVTGPSASTVKRTVTGPVKKTDKNEDRTWFKKGAFSDGYQFWDVTKTLLGTAADVGENIGTGIIGMGERAVDALTMLGTTMGNNQMSQLSNDELAFKALIGKSKQADKTVKKYDVWQKDAKKGATEFVKKDLYDEKAISKKILTAPFEKSTKINTEEVSILGEKSDSHVQSAGQLLATAGLSAVGMPWFLTTGVTSFGAEAENAMNEGATFEQATMSAAVSAGAEILSEKLFGGIKFGGKTLDDVMLKPFIEKISSKAVKALVNIGVDTAGEGAEEVFSSVFSRLGSALYKEESIGELLTSEEACDEYLESFIGGAFLGGVSSGVKTVANINKSELTENEQKVVDKVVEDRIAEKEKDGKKLTNKDKNKIFDEVVKDLTEGAIDTDTIESVLGGETYKTYKDTTDNEAALQKEFDTLNKMKQGDMTGEQTDRRAELKQQLEEIKINSKSSQLKNQLSTEVSNLVKDSRLAESYNEKARRREVFTADLTKYDAKQQETVKNAVESGILNNTRRTHGFVDMIAKISADKGVSFDFTNNQKLKESGFAIEGKTVNGLITKDGIKINVNSAKALNKVVGHEITHILKGTELYTEVQTMLKSIAESKGEYQSRYDEISKLYEGIEGVNIEEELMADLVGDFLFTDRNFISRLSAEKPGVFKKIFDEIKYLCRVATAGSKEAKELEKVKKTFEELYRKSKAEKNTAEGGVIKYSLMNDVPFEDNVKDVINMTDEVALKNKEQGNFIRVMNNTPSVILENIEDAGDYEVIIRFDALYLASRKDGVLEGHYHNLGEDIIAKLPDFIENPDAIVRMNNGRLNLFTTIETSKGNNGIISMEMNTVKDINSKYNKYNLVVSVFSAKDNYTRNNLSKNGEKVEYKKEDLSQVNPQLYEWLTIINDKSSKGSISDSPKNVKQKDSFSLSSKDTAPKKYGDYAVYGEDVMLEGEAKPTGKREFTAPTRESITEGKQAKTAPTGKREFTAPMRADKNLDYEFPMIDDTVPISKKQIADMQREDREAAESITDADMPPQAEVPIYSADTIPLNKKTLKNVSDVGRKILMLNAKEKRSLTELIQKYSTSEMTGEVKLDKEQKKIFGKDYESASEVELFDELKKLFGEKSFTERIEEVANVRRALSGYRIGVSSYIKNGISDYAEFRKRNFGKLFIANDGIPVDTAYMELSEAYPDFFPSDIVNPTDQLLQMAEVANMERDITTTYEVDDDVIREATEAIGDMVGSYQEKQLIKTTEREGKAILRDELKKEKEAQKELSLLDKYRQKAEKQLEIDKEELKKIFEQRKAELHEEIKDKNTFISKKAKGFYDEISSLRKGVRASSELGYFLDLGFEWSELKSTLLKVSKWPGTVINPNSSVESVVREAIIRDYEDKASYGFDDLDAEYNKQVEQMKAATENKIEEYRAREFTRPGLHSRIVDGIKAKFTEKGFDFDKVLSDAKNLSTFSTVDNTPQRVIEKTLGYKPGQILADETVNKVAQNESEGIKWLNSYLDIKSGLLAEISRKYKIKPGSKESAAAQMYAEGFYVNEQNEIIRYGENELTKDFPDVNVRERIKSLARDEQIRQIYDETLDAINESRKRNLYPEIPRLDNYFLHFRAMDDTFSRLGLPFNPSDIRAKDLPTDLNGVTADLKPGQPYFASAMHREGKRTTFDLLGGLERYLTSAKNQIYHIDNIQTLRAVRNYIADTFGQGNGLGNLDSLTEEEAQERIEKVYGSHLSTFAKFLNEEANVLAGKTTLIDRGLEGIIGRRGISFLNTVNGQVGSNMVGFNISSSLTNFLPVVQTMAKTNKGDFVKALAQTSANKLNSLKGKSDGFKEKSPVIIRRKGADRFYRTPYQKIGDAGYILMSAVDDVSTEIIARTKYNELTRKGMDEQQAHFETDKWVSRLMGDRSLGQMPQLYNSKMLGIVTKFQLEVRNQLDSMFYDTIQDAKISNEEIENKLLRNAKTAAKVAKTLFELAVLQHGFGWAFEKVAGYNPAFDIIEVLIKTFGLDDDENDEDTVLDNIEEGFFALLQDLPYTGTLTGGRIPISSALPINELIKGKDQYGNEKSREKTLVDAVPYYLLPTGFGQIKKSAKGLKMFDKDLPIAGSYTDSGNLRFPVEKTPGNIVQAALFGQYASKNAQTYFDEGYAPLKEKQIQEFKDLGLPIADYWKIREGLSALEPEEGKTQVTLNQKGDYIGGLDLPIKTKNVLINSIADRETPIDMKTYGKYKDFEEFDFATKNPDIYKVLQDEGISVKEYKDKYEKSVFMRTDDFAWAADNPESFALSKAVTDNLSEYRKYAGKLYEIKADKDRDGKAISGSAKKKKRAYIWSLDIPDEAKYILYRKEYPSDDTYNGAIINYILGRDDISYVDKNTILEELDFIIGDDGRISWK